MEKFYSVIEVQINDGVPSSPAVVITDSDDQAIGEMHSKLGYAYQHPRDYTAVVILDEKGENMTKFYRIPNVLDNRKEKTPVFAVAEIQINDGVRSAVPVNVQVGENAQSVIMQAYHNGLSYAWNVKRDYTMSAVINTNGINEADEVIDFMPVEEAEPEE